MSNTKIQRIKTITEFHRLRGLSKPEHPLISVVDYAAIRHTADSNLISWVLDFYSISLKRTSNAKIKYGQQDYDFDEGVMFFMAPNQVFRVEAGQSPATKHSGWILLIHPDFLWNTTLAKSIQHYEYFNYAVNEALFLSDREEATITNIVQNIEQEYHTNIDKFSQRVIVSQIEVLLNYAERFYNRQFITRKKASHQVLEKLEILLLNYFNSGELVKKGIPTVQYIAETLNVSPNYLSGLLKVLTGKSTQQHVQDKLIDAAKEKLSTTDLSISEIAYELGFEYPQTFGSLFKKKTKFSPREFRQSFN
jgi:AraC family transcriptional activator of pobA